MDDQEMFKPLKDFSAAEVAPQGGTVRALPSDLTEREEIDLLYQVETYMSVTDKHSQTHPAAAAEEARIYSLVNGLIAKRFSDIGAAVRGEAVAVQTGWKFVPVEATWEMTRPAFSFDVWRVRCDCGQEHSGGLSHNKAAQLFKSMADAAPASARAADAPSEPSESLGRDCDLLTMEQVNAIRDTIKPGDGWDGDNWDFALANAVAAKVKSRAADALDSQPTVLDGWMLVPKEPTDTMYFAACHAFHAWQYTTTEQHNFTHADTYRAMLAAVQAPEQASSQPTDGGVRNG